MKHLFLLLVAITILCGISGCASTQSRATTTTTTTEQTMMTPVTQ